jgi:hypothetical protein
VILHIFAFYVCREVLTLKSGMIDAPVPTLLAIFKLPTITGNWGGM